MRVLDCLELRVVVAVECLLETGLLPVTLVNVRTPARCEALQGGH